jgi:uncharacterized protein YdcH (DUF465 family)
MEKHDLHAEFPQHNDRIHELKVSDKHFRKLFDEYHTTNKTIHSVEANGKFTDKELNELRSKRVHLKDQLILIIEGKK